MSEHGGLPVFHPPPMGPVTIRVPVDGIHCAGCVSRVEAALAKVRASQRSP